MFSPIKQKFLDNAIISKLSGKRYLVKCKKGLWGHIGRDKQKVLEDAFQSFMRMERAGVYGESIALGGNEEGVGNDQ